MAKALKASDIPSHKTKVQKAKRDRKDREALQEKQFSDLSASEKDDLLRVVAVRLGLIKG